MKLAALSLPALLAGLLISGPLALAQEAAPPDTIQSMGFPQKWKPNVGFAVAWDRRGSSARATGEFNVNVYRDLGNPVMGLLGLTAEGYAELVEDNRFEGGGRLFASFPVLHLHLGADYSTYADNVRFTAALTVPFRRSGIVGGGSHVRIQYTPGRHDFLSVGLQIPIFQPHAGATRAKFDRIGLPRRDRRRGDPAPLSTEINDRLGTMSHAAAWIRTFTVPAFDTQHRTPEELAQDLGPRIAEFRRHFNLRSELFPEGHHYEAEVRVFHDQMDQVFALVADDREAGRRIAAHTRAELLEEIILPYDRLLGRRKMRDSLLALGDAAIKGLDGWLTREEPGLTPLQRDQAVTVFERIVAMMDRERANLLERWGDNRYVWIPMQFALRPEDHDERHELDALLESLTETEFTDGNRLIYVANEQFQAELGRMITQTEDYHVLWIHDYRGLDAEGEPDSIAYLMTRIYLQALRRAVDRYDERGRVPALMIFLDQHYYEINKGEIWLRLLADPLRHEFDLPEGFEAMERGIAEDQAALRAAVAASDRLQADAQRWGLDWLHDTIKVHVNITNPPDFSFRSRHVIPNVRFIPDTLMRDHRKIAFRDVTEEDPDLGEALFTGEGVGEHYVGPTWDDRAVMIDGPALVDLKTAARELLRSQGFAPEEIPEPLRPDPFPSDYAERIAARVEAGNVHRGMQLHNTTGFGRKAINPAKAGLYTLMPAGSHLWVPDSLWNSPLWASMMVSAAFRGATVIPAAPSLANAPSAGAPTMSRANEIFSTFVSFNQHLGDLFEASGGRLAPGIYDVDVDASDIPARFNYLPQIDERATRMRLDLPFSESAQQMIREVPEIIEEAGIERAPLGEGIADGRPRLHLKAQLFMSGELVDSLMRQDAMGAFLQRYFVERAVLSSIGDQYIPVREAANRLIGPAQETLAAWAAGLDAAEFERMLAYFIGGSHNQDYRSTMMDGEVMFLASGTSAMATFPDMLLTMGSLTEITSLEQLEGLLPPFEGFARQLGRWIQNAL